MNNRRNTGDVMGNEHGVREQLSAWLDGEAQAAQGDTAIDALLDYALSPQGQQDCLTYQAIGHALRQSQPRVAHDSQLLERLRVQLESEAQPLTLQLQSCALQQVAPREGREGDAANSAVWRWRAVAGLASVVAVSTLAWNMFGSAEPTHQGQQLAQTQLSMPALVLTAAGSSTLPANPVMIRDPRLDELMASYRQYGNTAALQMPARFLRNASIAAQRSEAPAQK